MNVMPEIHDLQQASSMIMDNHDAFIAQTSNWLADAAAAAADAPVDTLASDNELWEKYISIYKGGLAFVHDNIVDEPLRKMGITQTWGPSIFVFTAAVRSLLIPFSIQQN